ncbi:TetR/AcrR family transcriptional regulator [Sphingobium tyrosinilyticum]|uniref:TetR/AcrR family transcriptional regulator n=1 Tax=Sphingobium tyrosinilyticum TaxID=2715436 RepID=A0ABV9F182_9SPHN
MKFLAPEPIAPSSKKKHPVKAGRPHAKEIERRKAKVIEMATELFVTKGYAATSFVEIAAKAGVATGTIYHHFGDKEKLFRRVVMAPDDSRPPIPMLHRADTVETALVRLGQFICDMSLRPQAVRLIRLLIIDGRNFPDLMRDVAQSSFSQFQECIAEFFDRLAQSELIDHGDHGTTARIFIDLILGGYPVANYGSWSTEMPSQDYIEARVSVFLQGCLSRPRSQKNC